MTVIDTWAAVEVDTTSGTTHTPNAATVSLSDCSIILLFARAVATGATDITFTPPTGYTMVATSSEPGGASSASIASAVAFRKAQTGTVTPGAFTTNVATVANLYHLLGSESGPAFSDAPSGVASPTGSLVEVYTPPVPPTPQTLLVRERPPLRLSVQVKMPDGTRSRWATDDPDPRNVPNAMQFSDAMPGGCETFSCTLERDPARQWPDLTPLSDLVVKGATGFKAFQGRINGKPDTTGSEAQISPQATGYQDHATDRPAAMIYIDQSLSNWGDPPLARQIVMVQADRQQGSYSVGFDPQNDEPALVQEIDDNWTAPNTPVVEAWYDSQSAGPIASIWYDLNGPDGGAGTVDANWQEFLAVCSDSGGGGQELSANLESNSEVVGTFTPATPERYAYVQHRYAHTPAGKSGKKYIAYWRLAVMGNHGLTLQGSNPGGVLASDVIKHATSTWCPLVDFTNDSIQPSVFIIPQLAFTDLTTAADIIKQATSYEVLDWAIFPGKPGHAHAMMYAGPRDSLGRKWRAPVGPSQLQNAGAQAARLYNGVIVSYATISGQTLTVGPPGSGANVEDSSLVDSDPLNPANQILDSNGNVVPKWAPLAMSGDSTSLAAIKVGQEYLQAQKDIDRSGSATIVGWCEDEFGIWRPAYEMRAGDLIRFPDASDTSYRRIVNKSYDDPTRTATIQLDQPPDTITALLERLSVVLAPGGLS